ncbi:MAG TPA: galactose oxidase early set domain-containing protein [Frankiaceae bacterium]|nr:galactose oxidase early set domain-containing protein [Frankiaceae bacterium]
MRRSSGILALAVTAAALPFTAPARAADPSVVGAFGAPFEEPGPKCVEDAKGRTICKPAAVSQVALPDGTVLYWDGLEGMEDVEYNTVAEIGHQAQDDQSRLLDLRSGRPRWSVPGQPTGGPPNGRVGDEWLPVVPHNNDRTDNDGDLFCSDQVHLADGRVLNVGGTAYYLEPGVSGVPYGLSELEGLKATRVYDTAARRWRPAKGAMRYGRWYPSLVTLPSGKVLVASGVTKLIKPMYANRPADSGTNVKQLETFDPRTETWSPNKATADRSLPLYPRLHLLPDGRVYYDAAGQAFNPDGQSYDEALWNVAAVYDPATQTWSDVGLPAFGPALRGFRGSAFSQQLPLRAPYDKAEFLSAGGVYGVTPGTYVGTSTSTLNTIDVGGGRTEFNTQTTGDMVNGRWYSTGVTLPTGEVVAFSGADRDEVVGPGGGTPVTQAELYDPAAQSWRALASARKGRTYHNSAMLLPDGRVLVGGHAPINTGYAFPTNDGRGALGLSDAFRDSSFEVFSPPNLFYGPRPVITNYAASQPYRKTTTIKTTDARDIASVVLVRNPAITHLVNGDQKVIELPIVKRGRNSVTVATPPSANVAVPGPYWLFVNKKTVKGLTPSVGRQVYVGAPVPKALRKTIERNNAASVRRELGARRGIGAKSDVRAGRPAVLPALVTDGRRRPQV